MAYVIDKPALDLLHALHLGCRATLVEVGDGYAWTVKHRIFADKRSRWGGLDEEGKIEATDVTYTRSSRVVDDTERRVDRWGGPERDHPVTDGLRLIRAGLVKRSSDEIELTSTGHGLAAQAIGDGLSFDWKGKAEVPKTSAPPAFDVVELAETVVPYPRVQCHQHLAIERDDRAQSIVLTVKRGEEEVDSYIAFGSARTVIALLGDAGKAADRVEAEFGSNLTVSIHDAARPAGLRISKEYQYIEVELRTPMPRLLREYLRENVKKDGSGMLMKPVEVRWHRFDAHWDEIID